MKSNSFDWFFPSFCEKEKQSLNKLVKSNFLNEGALTRKFESKVSKFLNVKYAVSVTSGTIAIALSLLAIGVRRGDKVIIPNFTFIATANAVTLVGATPIFVDVLEDNFTIDVNKIERLIENNVKAIIPVDVNGRACDYKSLEIISQKYNIPLITDSAEALGSKVNGKFLGTFGDCGCFSFSAAKTLSTGQGGMIVTNKKNIYNRLLELKDQGRRKRGTGGNDLHPVIGFNFKYTDLQASVGIEQFYKLKKRIYNFKLRDLHYSKNLKGIDDIIIPQKRKDEVLQWFDVLIKKKKKELLKFLKRKKIGYREFWYPITSQKPYEKNISFKNTFKISKEGLWLPSNFSLKKEHVEEICYYIGKFYGN